MKVIGLTSGIGAGKTTVLRMFRKLGAKTINADEIVKKLYKKKSMKQQLKKNFHTFDKKALAGIVFSDKKKLENLEKIVHPLVFREIKKQLGKSKKPGLAVVEVPLLFESKKFLQLVDHVIAVKAKKRQQIARLKKKGVPRKHVLQRMAFQLPLKEKLKRADFVIDNSKSLSFTKKQVEQIYGFLSHG